MCERFALPQRAAAEREFNPAKCWWRFGEKFNVAAPQNVPAVRRHEGESEGVMMRWGLIPSWRQAPCSAQDLPGVDAQRVELAEECRGAWLNSQRCIVPVTGYYVWRLTGDKYRQPYFIQLADRSVFGLAAIWDRWVSEEDDVIESCCLLSVPANQMMTALAGARSRMPAILRRCDYGHWLHGTPATAKGALQPYDARRMQAHAVSPRVNSAAYDDRGLITPVHCVPKANFAAQ